MWIHEKFQILKAQKKVKRKLEHLKEKKLWKERRERVIKN